MRRNITLNHCGSLNQVRAGHARKVLTDLLVRNRDERSPDYEILTDVEARSLYILLYNRNPIEEDERED